MSKNKVKNKAQKSIKIPFNYVLFPFKNGKQPYIVLALVGLILYFNTIYNEFALDDGIIIHKNEYVMEGVSGIDSIMSRDAYHSFYKQMNAKDQLAGGRYRPLSVVTFAIEQEFIGKYKNGLLGQNCWDENKNGKPDLDSEDINGDGLANDNDCLVKGCMLRHFNNMLLYVISILLIYNLLFNFIFKNNHDLAFLASFIFLIHPIHTEVVANMKSRDEILSMLFIAWTFIYCFKFSSLSTIKNAIISGVLFFLALLSKEYAVTLMAVIPAMLFLFDEKYDFKLRPAIIYFGVFALLAFIAIKLSKQSIGGVFVISILGLFLINRFAKMGHYHKLFIAIGAACLAYLAIRFSIVVSKPSVPDTEILNNPYLLASVSEKWATKIYVLMKYLMLLIVPHPLSSDYSYNTIEYRTFASWDTWLSIFLHIGLAILGLKLLIKKHPLAFAFVFYFANLAMIGNILFDIGATMGERLIYHSSFGFAIGLAWVLVEYGGKIIKNKALHKSIVIGYAVITGVLFGYKVIVRNTEWKSDITLFTTDVETVPNSVLCLGNAGARWIDLSERPANKANEKEYLKKAIGYLDHALALHPGYVNGYLNLGLAYMKAGDLPKAEAAWGEAQKRYPNNPYLISYYRFLANTYMGQGLNLGKEGKVVEALALLEKASAIDQYNPEIWYNLGGAAYSQGMYDKAKQAFERCLKLNPNYQAATQGLVSVQQMLSQGATNVPAVNSKTVAVTQAEILEDPTKKLPAVLNGNYTLFNKNKQKTKDGVFKENRFMEGRNYIYNEKGEMLKVEVYKNGIYIGDEQRK